MKQWLGYPSVQIALCTACYALLAYWTDKWTVVFVSPLYGAAIARPLINWVANIRQVLRAQVWLPVHGKHYVFKGTTVRVLEDEDDWRWVRVDDVQAALGMAMNTRQLALTYPGRVEGMGRPAQLHIRDDALVEFLGRQQDATALRLRTWVERNIAFPAERLRRR